MSLWLRITLTWILALALPLQGHAAQTMIKCGPVHDTSTRLAFLLQPSDGPHAQAHSHAPGESIGHGEPAAADQGAVQAGSSDPAPHASHGKCSVCASCSGALALTSAVLVFEASPAPTHYRAEAQAPSPGTIPGGLERPPRNPLA